MNFKKSLFILLVTLSSLFLYSHDIEQIWSDNFGVILSREHLIEWGYKSENGKDVFIYVILKEDSKCFEYIFVKEKFVMKRTLSVNKMLFNNRSIRKGVKSYPLNLL